MTVSGPLASLAGIDEIYRIGGAQAVGALAYGTETVPQVDKIVGPGNAYVAAAKRRVFGQVGIDMIAGPSEILVLADGTLSVGKATLNVTADDKAKTVKVGAPKPAARKTAAKTVRDLRIAEVVRQDGAPFRHPARPAAREGAEVDAGGKLLGRADRLGRPPGHRPERPTLHEQCRDPDDHGERHFHYWRDRAADAVVQHRHVKFARHGVDQVGAVGETPERVDGRPPAPEPRRDDKERRRV